MLIVHFDSPFHPEQPHHLAKQLNLVNTPVRNNIYALYEHQELIIFDKDAESGEPLKEYFQKWISVFDDFCILKRSVKDVLVKVKVMDQMYSDLTDARVIAMSRELAPEYDKLLQDSNRDYDIPLDLRSQGIYTEIYQFWETYFKSKPRTDEQKLKFKGDTLGHMKLIDFSELYEKFKQLGIPDRYGSDINSSHENLEGNFEHIQSKEDKLTTSVKNFKAAFKANVDKNF